MGLSWRRGSDHRARPDGHRRGPQQDLEVRANEPDPESLALWVEVSGQSGGAYTYEMYFRPVAEAGADDVVQRHDDLSIVVPAESVDKLVGATLDFTGAGMVMQNPNRPAASPPMAVTAAGRSVRRGAAARAQGARGADQPGDRVARRPRRAGRGRGRGSSYLRLSGGCQGCGMASVTLSQGIEVAILDSVPEVTEVIDVTDHASGANPYYEAAKK